MISQVANELKSGDLCSPLGDKFRDYRQQLIPWDQFEREVSVYGDQTGIPTEAKRFVQSLQEMLISTSRNTDERFPQNESVRIENGEPILSPLGAKYEPEDLKLVETWIKERMEHVEIIDALVDTEHWLHWTRYFGPLSGHDAKVDRLRERYVLTVFCYGCNLGPTQTARSIKDLDRFKLAFVNQRHITEANLNEAIATVVNTYVQFPLQRLWGLGHSASADGMKWDLYPQTLMSEYHIRYGGYGGIGYYLVSDNYIALMSRFTTCGSWEGHYILDFLQENKSEVQPDTIHADTQGQSTAIFGLAYLLGIELMPRIRNWKDQHLFRPAPDGRTAREAPGILPAGGPRGTARRRGAQQCGTHYRAAVLQPAARPCRPSAPNYQRGGFASHYRGPQQGLGRIFKRTDSREREFWTHDRDARSARLHRL